MFNKANLREYPVLEHQRFCDCGHSPGPVTREPASAIWNKLSRSPSIYHPQWRTTFNLITITGRTFLAQINLSFPWTNVYTSLFSSSFSSMSALHGFLLSWSPAKSMRWGTGQHDKWDILLLHLPLMSNSSSMVWWISEGPRALEWHN